MRAVRDWWAETGWPVRLVWLAGALLFAWVTVDAYYAYDSKAWDFRWVHQALDRFLRGEDPYEVFLFVNPPATLLLLAPFGLLGFQAAHAAFLAVSAAALLAAGFFSLKAAGLRWSGPAGALVLIGLALPSAVRSTLGLGNVNALVVACEAAALWAMLASRWRAAGVLLGLSFAIKPIVVALLAVPLLLRRWSCIALAAAVPLALSALALAIDPDAMAFASDRLGFLWRGNADVFRAGNVSIRGAFHNLSLPGAAGTLTSIAVLVGGAALAWLRWRSEPPGETDVQRRLRTLETTGLLLLVTLLCFSFSWLYYGVFLLPLVVTLALPGSLMRHPLAIAGVVLMLAPVGDTIQAFQPGGFEQVRPTVSWLLMLTGMGARLLRRQSSAVASRPAKQLPV